MPNLLDLNWKVLVLVSNSANVDDANISLMQRDD
jgi:hypothetical protein